MHCSACWKRIARDGCQLQLKPFQFYIVKTAED